MHHFLYDTLCFLSSLHLAHQSEIAAIETRQHTVASSENHA